MDLTLFYTIVGFGLAGWSVIANDSVQTLGTFIASKSKWFKWYTLAGSASFMMAVVLIYGWWAYDGDISFGRLTRIPYQEIQWYHAVAPGILLLLTKILPILLWKENIFLRIELILLNFFFSSVFFL